jgi:hypothetical protein
VASYSAVINVSVSGQAALDKLEGSARSIQTLIQGIKQQKNIFDQAVGSEKTRELKKNLDSLVTSFAAAQDGARQFEVVVGGKTRKVNMYSKTLAGLSHQLGTFRAISDNATVGTDRFVNSLIAANKVSNELARTQARAMTAGTGVTGTPKNVQEVLALGKAIPNTIEGLSFYKGKLEELLATLKLTSNEFRAVEEASAAVDVRLGNARLTGQTSKITPAAGPASRIDTVASYEKRAGFAQKVADLEYKQLLTGQQIVKSKLDETQQAELQNRLEQASQALAEGDLALAKRLTNELRNQRIQYERINRDREALMRPTSMVAGASLPVRGGKDIIDSPINLQEGTKAAVALAQQKQRALAEELSALQAGTKAAVSLAQQKLKAAADELQALQGGTKAAVALARQKEKAAADELEALQAGTKASLAQQKEKAAADELEALQAGTKAAVSLGQQKLKATGPEKAEASQKRLNNLLNSALIAEQAIIKTAKKGIDVKDEQAQIQSVITKLQQLDVTATKAELSLYDELLNAVRNELRLKKAIASTDAESAKSTKAKAKTQTKTQTKTKGMGLSDALIGFAFPLLFGQGIGAAAGGGLGGFAGAKISGGKGGFGGSLAGTLIGQATIDFAINSAVRLGQALQDPTEKIGELIGFLGIAGTELNANIKVLQSLGLTSTASAVALAKLESLLKEEGFKNAEEFSKDLQNLTNAFSRLQLAAANLAGGALPGILDALTNLVKGMSQMPLEPLVPKAKSPADAIKQAQAFNFIGPTADPVATAERVAEEAVTAEMQRQINLATAQKNLEADKLSLTRVDLATRQGAVAIQQVQNELTRKQLELDNARGTAAEKLLGLEVKILQQQEAQAQAAQRNAVIEAQRQVDRQTGGLMIEQTELENQIFGLRSQSARLLHGEEVGIASQLNSIEQRYENELGILVVRRDLEKLGINEADVLQEIQTKYDGLASVLKQRLKNEIETLNQQQAQYKLTQMQIDQQRTLANLETKGRFKQELQRTQSFQDPTGLVPFFGDALVNEKLALEDYNTTLGLYNAQLLNLEERMAIPGLNPDVLRGLTQQSDALKDQVALYREYQPAIIQARLEQEKFNTIFNATKTVVDDLANSLVGVVSGTMTAKEAFASFLMTIGQMLAEEGKKMIATYIAIGIARMFAGIASAAGSTAIPGAAPQMTPGAVVTPTGFQGQFAGMAANGATFANGIAKFASGGIVSSPTLFKFADGGTTRTGLMGEAGPEAIMPLKRGADGSLGVQANGLREAMNQDRAGGSGSPVLNMSFQSTNINGVEYVSRDQLEAAMAQTRRDASRDGAKRGMTMTLDKLQQSPSTRSRVGMR